jgi:hypothetical protein
MSWLIGEISVYRASWQSGNRRKQCRTGEQPLPGRAGHQPIVLGRKFREPDVARLNEGVGEHVRTKISPRLSSEDEIADRTADPQRTKKTCFFCCTGFEGHECRPKFDPAV